MNHITLKRIFDIPQGSTLEEKNGLLYYEGKVKFSKSIFKDMPGCFEKVEKNEVEYKYKRLPK